MKSNLLLFLVALVEFVIAHMYDYPMWTQAFIGFIAGFAIPFPNWNFTCKPTERNNK